MVIAASLVVSSTARNLFQVIAKATHSIGAFFGGVEWKYPLTSPNVDPDLHLSSIPATIFADEE
jgi:hypothetical protein